MSNNLRNYVMYWYVYQCDVLWPAVVPPSTPLAAHEPHHVPADAAALAGLHASGCWHRTRTQKMMN